MSKPVLATTEPDRPCNIVIEYYCVARSGKHDYNYTLSVSYKYSEMNNNFFRDEIEILLMDGWDSENYNNSTFKEALESSAKSWIPLEVEIKATKPEMPPIPEGMEDRRFVITHNGDQSHEVNLSEVLQRFLNDPDEELLSPLGIYNLFMLGVGEELPKELTADIKRIA